MRLAMCPPEHGQKGFCLGSEFHPIRARKECLETAIGPEEIGELGRDAFHLIPAMKRFVFLDVSGSWRNSLHLIQTSRPRARRRLRIEGSNSGLKPGQQLSHSCKFRSKRRHFSRPNQKVAPGRCPMQGRGPNKGDAPARGKRAKLFQMEKVEKTELRLRAEKEEPLNSTPSRPESTNQQALPWLLSWAEVALTREKFAIPQ